MPTLRKYVDKDDYYIKAYVPGRGQNSTLQVTPEGLRRIWNVIGKKEGAFPLNLLHALLQERLVYTKGLHPLASLPRINVASSTPQLKQQSVCRLIFIEGQPIWKLALHIAELPNGWGQHVHSLVEALSTWRICVEGTSPVPATQLWPGRGGALISVAPQSKPYHVIPEGHWPDAWDVHAWIGTPPGLRLGATLFRVDSGERLESDVAVELGSAYTLVVPRDTVARQTLFPPPAFLTPESLGQSGTWQAWSIQIPVSHDNHLREWCAGIGYRLAEPRFRLALVTPPHGYSDTGQPIITTDKDVILALVPVGTSSEQRPAPTFYTTCFQEPGTFRLSTGDLSDAALHVVVERRSVKISTERPRPLAITLEQNGVKISIQAFRDGVGPHELKMSTAYPNQKPTINVHCPVLLCLAWRVGKLHQQRESITADEAGTIIASILQESAQHQQGLSLKIDAGAYGRICLELAAAPKITATSLALGSTAEHRVRWLAAVLHHSPNGDLRIPLTASARQALAYLSEIPGCAGLRSLHSVPASLVPHIHAIMRLVQQ